MQRVIVLLMMLLPSLGYANNLVKGEVYRTRVYTEVGNTINVPTGIRVGAKSKFIVLDNKNEKVYAIKFKKVYMPSSKKVDMPSSMIDKNKIYYTSKNIGAQNETAPALDDVVNKSFSGIVSGPLIVPFKYRLDDKSITGEAMIGYYAGYGFDIGNAEFNIAVTPFLSAGVSQVSINSIGDDGSLKTDSKTGFTWSTGFLIKNWDTINIGLVYGQDRIGDRLWEHEGKGWFSISIGWEL